MKCGWEYAVNVLKKLKYELIHVEEDKIYITTDWNLNSDYKFVINQIESSDDSYRALKCILYNMVKDVSEKLAVDITKIKKIAYGKDLPYGYLKDVVVTGIEKKLGSKRIILGQRTNGFVWKEIAFVENYKKRPPWCSGGGGLIWRWDYDEELIDYDEIIPDIVRRKVSLNSFKKGENNE